MRPSSDGSRRISKRLDPPAARSAISTAKPLTGTGVLASVNTWKKLYEVWPAARNVLIKLEPASADNLPAIIPQDLNDELELP